MSASEQARPAVNLAQLSEQSEKLLQGDASARRSLNALSVTSDLVIALIEHPGAKGSAESVVEAARSMVMSANDRTRELVEDLGLGEIGWARYRVMKMVSSAVSERWKTSAKANNEPSADVTDLMPVWKELAKHDLPTLTFDDPADQSRVALQVALLDAMEPVLKEISIFDMFRDPKEAALSARNLMTSTVKEALYGLGGQSMSARSRNQLMQSLLRNAGTIYAAAWRQHASDTVQDLQSMDTVRQRALVEMHQEVGGFPIKPIEDAFSASFMKLVEMVEYLADPKAVAAHQNVATVQHQQPAAKPSNDELPPSDAYFEPDVMDPMPSFSDHLDANEPQVRSSAN